MAAPPTRWRGWRMSVRSPAFARYAPLTRPLWPPPTTMASYRSGLIGPSGGLALRVVQGQPRDVRGDLLVVVVDGELQKDASAGLGEVGSHARERDVLLQHRRIHDAGCVADAGPIG